ncbi:MAG: hypothetical protein AAF449_18105 [Myxococcota bacterium]
MTDASSKPVRRPSRSERRAQRQLAARKDHEAFHHTVARATLGGTGGALTAHLGAVMAGTSLIEAPILFTVAVAAGALSMVAARDGRWLQALAGCGLGIVGVVLLLLAMPWPALGAALLGLSAVPVLAPRASRSTQARTAVLATIFATTGLFVGHVLLGWNPFEGWLPSPFMSAAAGGAAGLFFGLASAPKHLAPARDPVERALLTALSVKDGEIQTILQRALQIYRALQAELAARDDDPMASRLTERSGEAIMRILHIADQCRRVDADLASTPPAQLDDRIGELELKIDSVRDPAAQQTYRDALASLHEQKEAIDRIGLGRERIVARLHANVAILEKLRFSLIHLRNAQAERTGGEASPVVEALDELGRELDATASAVGEVFGGQALAALPEIAPNSAEHWTKEASDPAVQRRQETSDTTESSAQKAEHRVRHGTEGAMNSADHTTKKASQQDS